jgi:hypothetical protein
MKRIIPLITALTGLLVATYSQNLYPENDPITTYVEGMYYQTGPGSNNSAYNWTYPFGTKLTINKGISRNLELMTTSKNGEGLVFRQWSQGANAWMPWKKLVLEDANGKVGIGTTTPTTPLHVSGTATLQNQGDGAVVLDLKTERGWQFRQKGAGAGSNLELYNYSGLNKSFLIQTDGNVGIATASPTHKLTVNGGIKCEEVQVVVDVPADYVFEENYDLRALPEVEKYINENKHLPGVPDANYLIEKGWNIGEMSNKLLEKIEELTLYIIEQQKEIEQLKKMVYEKN